MRQIITFILIATFAIAGCKKDNIPDTVDEDVDVVGLTLLATGTIEADKVDNTAGNAFVYGSQDKKVLKLTDFNSKNGPDMKIYLSTDLEATDYVNLGAMKATSGTFSYDFDDAVDVTVYKYVLVWCEDYSKLFGHAELK